jgi:type II secretory pathway pseudopilin PulG
MTGSTFQNPSIISPVKLSIIFLILAMLLLTVVNAYFSATPRAEDQIRVNDVQLIRNFLSAYKTDFGLFPPAANAQPTGFEKYMEYIPTPPKSDCKDSAKYFYTVVSGGQSYNLTYCYGGKVNSAGPT